MRAFSTSGVELEGIEPSSGEVMPGAFYMFRIVCCRDAKGTILTLSHPYPAC